MKSVSPPLARPSTEQLLHTMIETLHDSKATDVVSLNVTKMTTITDMMIICTGRSSRHVKAIADILMRTCKTLGCAALSCTGDTDSEWILIDFNDIIVHIMQADTREHYQLEALWDRTNSLRRPTDKQ